jgi:CheY-like chemotaxis protein
MNELAIKRLSSSAALKILIVETNPIATSDLRSLFAKMECRVVTVTSSASMLRQVKEEGSYSIKYT